MLRYETERFGHPNYLEYSHHRDFNFPAHFHRSPELVWVYEGVLEISYQGRRISLHAGEAALFLPNDVHGFHTPEHSAFASAIFSPDRVPDFMASIENKQSHCPVFIPEGPLLQSLFMNFHPLIAHPLKANGILQYLCGCYLEQVSLTDAFRSGQQLLHRIISYIATHYQDDITLKTLAKHVGYDPFYLSRYISANLHTTFHKYLTHLRMAHAAYLLKHSDQKIIDIAMQSGYVCVRTFNGAFRKTFGMTPGAYILRGSPESLPALPVP